MSDIDNLYKTMYNEVYYNKNKESIQKKQLEYKEKNREKIRLYQKEYFQKNKGL